MIFVYRTGCFVWMEKYNLQLTALLEMALQNTQIVKRGFIESIIAAGTPDTFDTLEVSTFSPTSCPTKGTIQSPTTILEFSFNDLF